jgi:HEPN domain-containing protein
MSRLSKLFLNDALIILDEAQQSFEHEHWHRTVRKAQESVELALKGLLRWAGIEYSKIHKISESLKHPKLQAMLTLEELKRFAIIADNLALNRGLAFYGSEDTEVGASELFDREAAQKALDECRLIVLRVAAIVLHEKEEANDEAETENNGE